MKKIICLVLIVAMLFTFVGCIESDTENTSTDGSFNIITSNVTSSETSSNVISSETTSATSSENESSNTSSKDTSSKPTESSKPTVSNTSSITNTSSSTPKVDMVWISKTGSKYHSKSNCGNMKNPSKVTKEAAEKQGRTPCSKCY